MEEMATPSLRDCFEFTPVEGHRNLYTMRIRVPPLSPGQEAAEVDWDKFEKDINDAFEQVP